MPPRSPLPPRHGLQAAWVRTLDRDPDRPAPWRTLGEFLTERLATDAPVAQMLADGRFVDGSGTPIRADDPYRPHLFIWFHRDLRDEPTVPGEITVLHRDERLVVVDKPPFLSTIPRGRHVTQSVVVRLRRALDLPELSPAHRLDRLTSGVLMLTTQRRWRAAYQGVFEARSARKTYEALAGFDPALDFPFEVENRIVKDRGVWQARIEPGAPNSHTRIDLVEQRGDRARYRLTPSTGKTHQLRLHLCSLGVPIAGDPLYPLVRDVDVDDFSTPLQLVARRLAFTDPVDGSEREFVTDRTLDWSIR